MNARIAQSLVALAGLVLMASAGAAEGMDGTPPSGWSDPERVVGREEVLEALQVLKLYLAQSTDRDHSAAETGASAIVQALEEIPDASDGFDFENVPAAVRGDSPEPSGQTFGVAGAVGSPDGAGVAATNANPAGGTDLLLDGTAQGAVDTLVTESGIFRPSVSPQTFEITNGGGGGMTLDVNGNLAANTVAVSGSFTSNGLASLDGGIDVDGQFTVNEITGDLIALGELELSGVATLHGGAYFPSAFPIVFEGPIFNGFQTSIFVSDPTLDRTLTLPDASGTFVVSESSPQLGIESDGDLTFDQLQITGTGALGEGSITSNFGSIDVGEDSVRADSIVLQSFLSLNPVFDASGASPPSCSTATEGIAYYDAEEKNICFCDGVNYVYVSDNATVCSP